RARAEWTGRLRRAQLADELPLDPRGAGLLPAAGGARFPGRGSADGGDLSVACPSWRGGLQSAGEAARAAAEHVLGDPSQGTGAGAAEQSADGSRAPLRAARGLVAGAVAGCAGAVSAFRDAANVSWSLLLTVRGSHPSLEREADQPR